MYLNVSRAMCVCAFPERVLEAKSNVLEAFILIARGEQHDAGSDLDLVDAAGHQMGSIHAPLGACRVDGMGRDRDAVTGRGRRGRVQVRIAAAWKTRPGTGEAQRWPEAAENGPLCGLANAVIVLSCERRTVALPLPLTHRRSSSSETAR
jgi:hypothetical protein